MSLVFSRDKQIKPLPFIIYFSVVLLLAIFGLAVSIYLAVSHYRVYTDIGYRSFCAISKALNCDTVSQSPYAIFIGLPVSVWGIIGYIFILILLTFAWNKNAEKKRIWPILFSISLAYSGCSVALAFVSSVYIHSYCIMCIATYGINFLLLFYTWMIRRRFEKVYIIKGIMLDIRYLWERRYKFVFVFSVFLTGIIITTIYFPHYWYFEMPDISANITKGVTKDGHPWIGAEKPELEITEFVDYQCFQCKKTHFFLRQVVADNPDRIRLTHRHYPMDHEFNPTVAPEPFHVGSGKMALLAIYALEKGKFWEMNDALFTIDRKKGGIDISKLSQEVGVDRRGLLWAINSKVIQHKLSRDIWEGMRLKITGTPAYVINGEVYWGIYHLRFLKKC